MNKEFIPYEQALELKELGFDEPCYSYYFIYEDRLRQDFADVEYDYENRQEVLMPINGNKDSPKEYAIAPTYREVFKWFREKYQLYPNIVKNAKFGDWVCEWQSFGGNFQVIGAYHHYEEAELACIVKLIDIVKKQNLKG